MANQAPESGRHAAMFERKVDETYDSLPDTTPLYNAKVQPDLLEKLKHIAQQEGFQVEELIGKGGMGAVALARDSALGRHVALKFLSTAQTERSNERLRLEAERASRLGHENIIQVYSWHSVGNLTFYSMEYVEGETLEEYVRSRPTVDPVELFRIMAEASAGVAAAHEQGILHRDIKPQNIMISATGRVKVADFGLSSTVDEINELADGMSVSGTMGFMAPEQARGEEESFASDTYSLTATLYYALTGRMPYKKGQDSKTMLEKNQSGMIVPLFTVRNDLPQPVYRLVAKGLSRDKNRRFKDALAFKAALEDVLLNMDPADSGQTYNNRKKSFWRQPVFYVGLSAGLLAGILIALGLAAFELF